MSENLTLLILKGCRFVWGIRPSVFHPKYLDKGFIYYGFPNNWKHGNIGYTIRLVNQIDLPRDRYDATVWNDPAVAKFISTLIMNNENLTILILSGCRMVQCSFNLKIKAILNHSNTCGLVLYSNGAFRQIPREHVQLYKNALSIPYEQNVNYSDYKVIKFIADIQQDLKNA